MKYPHSMKFPGISSFLLLRSVPAPTNGINPQPSISGRGQWDIQCLRSSALRAGSAIFSPTKPVGTRGTVQIIWRNN